MTAYKTLLMKYFLAPVLFAGMLLAATVTVAMASVASQFPGSGSLVFDIFRKGDRIGSHEIRFEHDGDRLSVTTDITIRVGFAFITLYDYRHTARELWEGGKLVRLIANTDDDGADEFVRLQAVDGGFAGESTKGLLDLPSDIGFTSYWNRDYVMRRSWLDTQDGDVMAMSISAKGRETVDLRGEQVVAERFGGESDDGGAVDLWYAGGELVKMRFRAFDGSILDYRLR